MTFSFFSPKKCCRQIALRLFLQSCAGVNDITTFFSKVVPSNRAAGLKSDIFAYM